MISIVAALTLNPSPSCGVCRKHEGNVLRDSGYAVIEKNGVV